MPVCNCVKTGEKKSGTFNDNILVGHADKKSLTFEFTFINEAFMGASLKEVGSRYIFNVLLLAPFFDVLNFEGL